LRFISIWCVLGLLISALPATAEDVTKEDIVCALNPPQLRGVTVTGGAEEAPLSIDLYVNFAYSSADLTSDAESPSTGLDRRCETTVLMAFHS